MSQDQAIGPGIAPTGIDGLDAVLYGGLVADRLYLVSPDPGRRESGPDV